MNNKVIKFAVASMVVLNVSASIGEVSAAVAQNKVTHSESSIKLTMDKYKEGRSIYGDFSGKVTDIYLAKNGTVLKNTLASIRDDNSYSILPDKKLSNDIAKNSDKYTVIAYGRNHNVVATIEFNNGSKNLTNEISNVKYDSRAGVLTGTVDTNIKDLKISADGNKYDEISEINNGSFSIKVSNDFYHDVKFGKHTIIIEGLSDKDDVIAKTTIELG